MQNVATIISGKNFELNENEVNSIVDAIQHSGGIVEDVKTLSPNKAVDIYFVIISADDARYILSNLLENFDADFVVQPSNGRKKDLLISDMDSTIIKQECIDEIAACLGIKDKIADITERAMNGELDFKDALRERVSLLKGVSKNDLEKVFENQIELMEGAKELLATMNNNGARTVLVSGGFTFFTQKIKQLISFEYEEANILEFDEQDKLTGKVKEPILDSEAKLNCLKFHCDELGISSYKTIAVGDGANDLAMLKYAGLGVAYCAKPKVRAEANHHINIADLRHLLYIQGYREDQIIS
jgi:phosphoserine phosphatase